MVKTSFSKKPKVAVALSGGVDSGVSAYLLKEAGYDVLGFHLHLWAEGGWANKCCSTELSQTAKKLADQLGFPFYVLDYSRDFRKIVDDYFLKEYAAGRTPNPCVLCNEKIKFGKLLQFARELGCEYLATGHYARVKNLVSSIKYLVSEDSKDSKSDTLGAKLGDFEKLNSKYQILNTFSDAKKSARPLVALFEAQDKVKDQSYFLWRLTQDQLRHVLFPVGDLSKGEVWEIARVQNLPVYKSKESFEICFVGGDYREFLKEYIPDAFVTGDVVTIDGEVIGRHEGLPLYTIGQREGLKVKPRKGSGGFVPPLYIVGKDVEANRLIVGRWGECVRKEFWVEDINWIYQISNIKYQKYKAKIKNGEKGRLDKFDCDVRVRLRGEKVACRVGMEKNNTAKVILEEPLWGVTSGQSAVFYSGEEVLGGGIIFV